MTLYELSFEYERSTEALRRRVRELRQAEKTAADDEERQRIHSRILELEPLLREAREIAVLTRHYYERSYYRNEKYSL